MLIYPATTCFGYSVSPSKTKWGARNKIGIIINCKLKLYIILSKSYFSPLTVLNRICKLFNVIGVLKLNSQILELLKFKIPKGELLSIFFKNNCNLESFLKSRVYES